MDAELWLSESGRGKDRWMVCTLTMSPAEARRAAVGHLASELESGNARAAVWLADARLRPTAEELAAAREPYRRAEAQADGVPPVVTGKPRKIAKPPRTLGDRIVKDPPVSLHGPRKIASSGRSLRDRLLRGSPVNG
jgi:hypothetical protein